MTVKWVTVLFVARRISREGSWEGNGGFWDAEHGPPDSGQMFSPDASIERRYWRGVCMYRVKDVWVGPCGRLAENPRWFYPKKAPFRHHALFPWKQQPFPGEVATYSNALHKSGQKRDRTCTCVQEKVQTLRWCYHGNCYQLPWL